MILRGGWLFLLCCAAAAQDPGKLVEDATLTLDQAIERGLLESKDGVGIHAELTREDGGAAVFAVVVAEGRKTRRFVLDANDGKVLRTEPVDLDYTKQVELCKVPLRAAVAAALERLPGIATYARVLTVNDRWVSIHVRVVAGGQVVGVGVDGVTGKARVQQSLPSVAVRPFTDTFRVAPDEWASTGRNPYFVLEPGHVLVLEGGKGKLTITVLDETRVVDGVTTRVVEEREEKEGHLVEVSRNFFAISKRTNDVHYFGEEVDIYRDGKVVSHEGAWLAGEKGARWGLIMPGSPLHGARYCQEIAPDVAMDRAEIVSVTRKCETPAGKFEGCLETEESSTLEKGREKKFYAPGIGLIRDGDLVLTRHGRGG